MAESLLRHFMFGDEDQPPVKPRRPRAEKAAGAFLTIGELAEQLQVEQHVLRYWESKFPQIQPMKRAGGRRYYRPDDVETIKHIQRMLYRDGYTIRGAQQMLSGGQALPEQAEEAPKGQISEFPAPTVSVTKAKVTELLAQLQEMRRLLQA